MRKPTYEGLPVVNATKPITITPSKEDISCSTSGDPRRCVYANAYMRTHPECLFVNVNYTTTFIHAKIGDRYVVLKYTNGKKAKEAIKFYDGMGETEISLCPPLVLLPPVGDRKAGSGSHSPAGPYPSKADKSRTGEIVHRDPLNPAILYRKQHTRFRAGKCV